MWADIRCARPRMVITRYENSAAEGLDPDWGTQTVEATLYTYHASGLLRHVISPTGWRQMVNNGITNPEIANETQVNAYAATEYEYDGSDRVSKLWTNGLHVRLQQPDAVE